MYFFLNRVKSAKDDTINKLDVSLNNLNYEKDALINIKSANNAITKTTS